MAVLNEMVRKSLKLYEVLQGQIQSPALVSGQFPVSIQTAGWMGWELTT